MTVVVAMPSACETSGTLPHQSKIGDNLYAYPTPLPLIGRDQRIWQPGKTLECDVL